MCAASSEAGHIITFGTLAEVYKCTDLTLKMWAAIFNAVPTSRMEFFNPVYKDLIYKKWVQKKMFELGISKDRLSFSIESGYPELCALLRWKQRTCLCAASSEAGHKIARDFLHTIFF